MSLPAWQERLGAFMRENKNRVDTSPFMELLDLVCTTMDFDYYLVHKDEFDNLPEELVQHMLSLPGCKLRSPKYFHLVVKPGRRCIKIPCYPLSLENGFSWTKEQVNAILDLIIQTCPPGSLEKFGLGQPNSLYVEDCTLTHNSYFEDADTLCPKPDLERVHAVLRGQPGLQEIDLSMPYFKVTRETLSIIGETCHDLRSLFINLDGTEMSGKINLDKMRQLADGCPVVQNLELNGADIKHEAVKYALQHLRHLVSFIDASIQDIVTFCQSGGILPPKFKPCLSFQDESDVNNLSLIQAMCPNLNILGINYANNQDLSQYQFRSVKRLVISEINAQNIAQIETLLRECGADIVEIQLYALHDLASSNVALDLSVVTQHCPNLEMLNIWGVPISNTCAYNVTPGKVKSLRCLSLEDGPPHACTPPDDFLYPIICNGVLEHFDVPAVSPRLLERMTEEMRAAAVNSKPSPVFPKLTLLHVGRVGGGGQGNMALRQALDLVSLTPHVAWVRFESLNTSNKDKLRKFLDVFVDDFALS